MTRPTMTRRAALVALAAGALAATVAPGALAATVSPGLAAPAAAPPPIFVVFFHYGTMRLTPAAQAIIHRAAAAARRAEREGSFSHIKVIGYSDTTGTDDGAQRISERRAEAVRKALIAAGLPADKITAEGRGKKELAVQTPDQVREVRNRRVRIVLYRPGD